MNILTYTLDVSLMSRLAGSVENLQSLRYLVQRMEHCARSSSVFDGRKELQFIESVYKRGCQLHQALMEVQLAIDDLRHLQGQPPSPEDLNIIQRHQGQLGVIVSQMAAVCHALYLSGCPLITEGGSSYLESAELPEEAELPLKAINIGKSLSHELSEMSSVHSDLRHLLLPIASMAAHALVSSSLDEHAVAPSTESSINISNRTISLLLVATQKLAADGMESAAHGGADSQRDLDRLHRIMDQLRVTEVTSHCVEACRAVASVEDGGHARAEIIAILPFIQDYLQTLVASVAAYAKAIRDNYKLAYVVGRLMLDLAQKGFCKPQEASETDDQADGEDGEALEGTGMGAGSGDTNVSSEIHEESQVEGLQGEENDGEENEDDVGDAKDDHVEMEEDFEGHLEDRQDAEDVDESDGGSDGDHDEHAGDVDPLDPGAVDEKFWNGEQPNEGNDGDDLGGDAKQEKDASEDLAPREDGKETKRGRPEGDDPKEVPDQDHETADNLDDRQDANDERDDTHELNGNDSEVEDGKPNNEPMEPNVQQDELLDVPEDLKLDNREDEAGATDLDDNDIMNEDTDAVDSDAVDHDMDLDAEDPVEGGQPDEDNLEGHSKHEESDDNDTQQIEERTGLDISASSDQWTHEDGQHAGTSANKPTQASHDRSEQSREEAESGDNGSVPTRWGFNAAVLPASC